VLLVNEINTMPGFTSISMYPKLWEASGRPLPAVLDRLIDLALARHAEKARLARGLPPETALGS
jgi:D-alanine-D-alanine ligase